MGLRCGETLALTTHDIDLKHKKINVHRTLTTDECNAIIMGNKTKTYAGKRILPIPDFIYPYIIEQMQVAEKQENNYLNHITQDTHEEQMLIRNFKEFLNDILM